jgi:hypothetical protein
MDHRTTPSDAYTTKHVNIYIENNDVFDGVVDESEQCGEDGATTQLMNITYVQDNARTKFQSVDQKLENSKYYVEMWLNVRTHYKGATSALS